MRTKAFIYCRVSSLKQVTEGNGLQAQEQNCVEYAQQNDYEIIRIYKEEATSGAAISRKKLNELFVDIENIRKKDKNCHIVIVVDEVSRLAREVLIHVDLVTRATDLNASIKFVKQNFENSSMGKFLENLYASIAQLERDKNTERVVERMLARLKAGAYVYGRAKLGYVYTRNYQSGIGAIQTPHIKNGPIVTDAIERYASGELQTYSDVAKFLVDKGIVYEEGRHRDMPRKYNINSARAMFDNIEFYAGYIKSPDQGFELLDGKHTPLIDLDTYNRVQSRLNYKPGKKYSKASDDDYPLKGCLHCGECNKPMTTNGRGSTGKGGKKYLYYQCATKGCTEWKKGIKPDVIHTHLIELFRAINPSVEIFKQSEGIMLRLCKEQIANFDKERKKLALEIATIDTNLHLATKKLITLEDDLSSYIKDEMRRLKLQRSILSSKMDSERFNKYDVGGLINRLFSLLSMLEVLWIKSKLSHKKLLLKMLFPEGLHYTRKLHFRKPQKALIWRAIGEIPSVDVVLVDPKEFESLTF